MDLNLTKDDLRDLSSAQQKAILEAMFLAVGIDRYVDPDEQVVFRDKAQAIPWTLDLETINQTLAATRDRIASTAGQAAFLEWIDAIVKQLPGVALREKVLALMTSLAQVGGIAEGSEKGLLNAFAMAFELPDESIQRLKKAFGRD